MSTGIPPSLDDALSPVARRLCVFLRAPELGRVKTRLARRIGAEAALAAYERLVEHVLARLGPVAADSRELWYAGEGTNPKLKRWAQGWDATLHAQPEGDLGEKMLAGLAGISAEARSSVARGAATVLVGADCAGLTAAHCEHAWHILEAEPKTWVFAPAEDGGFGLVACRSAAALAASPFATVDWTAEQTLEQCLARARHAGLQTRLIESLWDVDSVADWERFNKTFR